MATSVSVRVRHEHRLHELEAVDGVVADLLERDRLAAAQPLVGRDQDLAAGVQDAIPQGVGREAGEDDRMDGADPGAGQHGVGQGRDHRQVDRDPVALPDPVRQEDVGHPADLVLQALVGDVLVLTRLRRPPR